MKLNLNENIRTYRKRLSMTQEQLSDRLGVSFQSVSRWENGTTVPDIELIVEMARLFGCTVDALLGCGEPKNKLTQQELRDALDDVLRKEDADGTARLLRTIRCEYLKEFPFLDHLLWLIRPGNALYGSETVMEEYRRLVDACLADPENRWTYPSMIHRLIRLEDEAHLKELIRRHRISHDWDMSEAGLYLSWARHHGDVPLCRRLAQELKVRRMYEFIREPMGLFLENGVVSREDPRKVERDAGPGDPMRWRRASERKLAILHCHSGITPDEAHPVSGDGAADIWAGAYLDIGFKYAAQLSAVGEADQALTSLEDCCELIEKLMDFPSGLAAYRDGFRYDYCPDLPVRDPDLDLLQAYRAPTCYLVNDEKREYPTSLHLALIGSYPGQKFMQSSFDVTVRLDFEARLTDQSKPTDDFYSSWYDPIRSHPRYHAVIERIRTVIPWNTMY